MESKSLFVFGICGYVGSRLAKHCVEELGGEFAEVSGTVPHHHAASSTSFPLTEHGELSNEAKAALERATHVLSVVPTQGDFTLEDGLVQRKAQQGQLKWAGYLSTTGVYGDRAGGLVFEEDECDAISARGKARVKMEQKWRETGAPVHVFRLPSIYGPGRRSLSKRPFLIHKPGQVFCRIHVEDLVQILVLSMRSPNPGRIYNCCDDEPAAPHEVSLFSYHLHQLPAPPAVDYASIQHELSDMERSFYLECKRITNHRVKMELGFVPKFPTYRQGLAHDAAAEFSEGQGNPTPVSQRGRPKPAPLAPVWQTWWYSHARPWLNKWWFAARWKLVRLWYWCLRKPVVLLVDNGSVREEPTIGMQRLAKALERRLGGWPVRACSWNHVDETQPSRPVLFSRRLVEFSMGRMVIVPLFLGPSAICVRDMPKLLSRSSQTIASTLVDLQQPAGECLVTKMLLQAIGPAHSLVKIVLVDHGSPNVAVNYVRRALAARVRAQLPPTARVVDCSMERRPGAQYAFNDPLLEHVFDLGGFDSGLVLVVPIFLFPGNHAGEGGDIAQILRRVRERHNSGQLDIQVKSLVFDPVNDQVAVDLLESKVKQSMLL